MIIYNKNYCVNRKYYLYELSDNVIRLEVKNDKVFSDMIHIIKFLNIPYKVILVNEKYIEHETNSFFNILNIRNRYSVGMMEYFIKIIFSGVEMNF
jgi:hypothetical protein